MTVLENARPLTKTFKTTFNTIANTYKAFSLTQAVTNELKYEMNQDSFLQLL